VVRWFKSRTIGAARVAVALAAGTGAFHVADYLVRNHPSVTAPLQARENAATVEVARRIYLANGWPGFEPDAVDAYADASATADDGACIPGFCTDPAETPALPVPFCEHP
jgi:hypothetical protein